MGAELDDPIGQAGELAAAGGMKIVDHWSPRVPEEDAAIYRMLHHHNCERKSERDHTCQGTISIRHDSLTLRCPLCGNVSAPL